MVPFGANAFYSILRLSYPVAALISGGSCIFFGAVGAAVARKKIELRVEPLAVLAFGIVVLLTIAAIVLAYHSATLISRGPALLYVNYTDHGGYAHLADWLNTYRAGEEPAANPSADRPYASWPAAMFALDPRFGSFGLLAIVSTLKGTSGLFAYDITCAIVVTAAILALSALVTETLTVFCLVVIGLFVSHWIDYAHFGFFGKLFGYPAILFVVGLSLKIRRDVTLDRLVSLLLLASAMGITHSGPAASLLCTAIFGAALTAHSIMERNQPALNPAAILFGAVTLAPTVASGLLARPTYCCGFPDWRSDWTYQLPRMFDLESLVGSITSLTPDILSLMAAISVLLWASLLAIAFRQRNICAVGMLGGIALLLIAFLALNARASALQLIGFCYPALICGAGYLLVAPLSRHKIAFLLTLLAIAGRIPRFEGFVGAYVLHPPAEYTISELEFNRIIAAIGTEGIVEVDIVNPQRAIAALVELGYYKVNVQWTARAWKTILGYRDWHVPQYTSPPTFVLDDPHERAPTGEIMWQSERYRLTRLPASG